MPSEISVRPLTLECWDDFERLFGPKGACAGCWCMYPRLVGKAFHAGTRENGAGNRAAMREIVEAGPPPGLLGYVDEQPVAWVATRPRAEYARLANSRLLKPLDDRPVWSIVCLFVDRAWRRRGLTVEMIDVACSWAAEQGATTVEAYPVIPRTESIPPVFAWWGLLSAYERAGFTVARLASQSRAIVRREVASQATVTA
ncbi:MAG: GNAT family N-acetyltransferase [Chloroflexota bacterium]|nr:MAG: GNAT family N-acetyltransferase [Chloroflexota bacterium]